MQVDSPFFAMPFTRRAWRSANCQDVRKTSGENRNATSPFLSTAPPQGDTVKWPCLYICQSIERGETPNRKAGDGGGFAQDRRPDAGDPRSQSVALDPGIRARARDFRISASCSCPAWRDKSAGVCPRPLTDTASCKPFLPGAASCPPSDAASCHSSGAVSCHSSGAASWHPSGAASWHPSGTDPRADPCAH